MYEFNFGNDTINISPYDTVPNIIKQVEFEMIPVMQSCILSELELMGIKNAPTIYARELGTRLGHDYVEWLLKVFTPMGHEEKCTKSNENVAEEWDIIYHPKNLWNHFRHKFGTAWGKQRWPVKFDKTIIKTTHTNVKTHNDISHYTVYPEYFKYYSELMQRYPGIHAPPVTVDDFRYGYSNDAKIFGYTPPQIIHMIGDWKCNHFGEP